MNVDYPNQAQTEQLKQLWQEAFADPDAFWELFATYGFAPDRCRCVTIDGQIAAALYWFDCSYSGKPLAYLYGIATAKTHRSKGLCRTLLENTHAHLKYLGYAGVVLVPADEPLRQMYEKMGYETCCCVTEFVCAVDSEAIQLRQIDKEEYSLLRRQFLPEKGILQEGDSLHFLEQLAQFYAGEDFLLTVAREEEFFAPELLGNAQAAPKILAALGQKQGKFRIPGNMQPFAMYHPLTDAPTPGYFGLAFD